MNKFLANEIKDQLRLIQMDYDIKGYIDTNEADEIIKHCQSLIEAIEDYQEDLREMESLTQKYYGAIEEIDSRGELILKQQKEIENLKQYKKVLMENSVVRSERIEELERLLEKERNMIDYLVKHHLSGDVYSFERFVEHGRLYALDKSKDGHIVNGVPWSFKLNGNAVTHENDDCYLVQTKIGFEKFTTKDLLVITPNGQLSIIKFSQPKESTIDTFDFDVNGF